MTRSGDNRELVAGWLVEHHAAMLRVAASFADSVHGPEDIVSRACVVALERHWEAEDVTRPRGWVLAITKSVALQLVRKRDRRSELRGAATLADSGLLESGDGDVFREWQSSRAPDERRERALEIARSLPHALRTLVDHVLIDGLDDREIAQACGITGAAVRQRRKRAVEAIRRRLSPAMPE